MFLPRIRVVSFDFIGTLARFAETPGAVYARFAPNLVSDPTKMQTALQQVYHEMKKAHPCYGHGEGGVSQRAFWLKTVDLAFEKYGVTDKEAVARIGPELYDYYATADAYKLSPNVEFVVRDLTRQNLELAIASNSDSRVRSVLKDLGLYDSFKYIFLSSERGYEKPSSQFFRLISPESGARSEEILHVGDRAELDYHPAKKLGMHAQIYTGEGSAGEIKGVPKEDQIETLSEVLVKWYDLQHVEPKHGMLEAH